MSTPKIIGSAVAAAAGAATLSVLLTTGHPWAAGAVLVTAALGAGLFPARETGRTTPSVSVDGYLSPVGGPLEASGDPEADSARHEDDLSTGRWVHLRPSDLD